jgi:glycosyltransferase involved in cell wall biosynthesis
MIVKDEAHGIARTLRAAKPYVDRWCILDTGSTDGTEEVIEREMAGVDGFVKRQDFVDFATSRNALLRITSTWDAAGEFLLLLDADDILEGGEALRAFLQNERTCLACRPPYGTEKAGHCPVCGGMSGRIGSAGEAFYLRMSEGACEWQSARVVRADAVDTSQRPEECDDTCDQWGPCKRCDWSGGWRYVGAVHEVLVHPHRPAPTITIPNVRIRHERGPVSADRMRARLERDVALLTSAAEQGDPRAVFYLAQSYKRMGRGAEAAPWFARRIAIGRSAGFWEEVYDSMFELARLSSWTEEHGGALFWFLRAHAFDPRRAEPLYEIAAHYLHAAKAKREAGGKSWRRQEEDALAFLFARRAAELPRPDGALFVNAEVYTWRAADVLAQAAWWCGEYETGERAARQAVEHGPAEAMHLRENLRFYEERSR